MRSFHVPIRFQTADFQVFCAQQKYAGMDGGTHGGCGLRDMAISLNGFSGLKLVLAEFSANDRNVLNRNESWNHR